MREKDLKLAVSQYLEYGTNQGKWYADRLNSGEVIVVAGQSRRRITLCREGTADFMVLQYYRNFTGGRWGQLRVYYLELKGDKGKQSDAQKEFQILVEAQGAEYFLVRSVEEVMEILGEEVI